MQINIYSISKKDIKYQALQEELCMQCKQFNAQITHFDLFPQSVKNAQKISSLKAQQSYTQVFLPYLNSAALNIALHPQGKSYDSVEFAHFIESYNLVQFFIGGAYGLEQSFIKLTHALSLSTMTFSHKIAKIVLCEQIYRALSILSSHPYHK